MNPILIYIYLVAFDYLFRNFSMWLITLVPKEDEVVPKYLDFVPRFEKNEFIDRLSTSYMVNTDHVNRGNNNLQFSSYKLLELFWREYEFLYNN